MLIEVVPSSKQIDDYDLTAKIAVVFDVLRATSTIVTALAHGCLGVMPALTVEEARSLAANPKQMVAHANPENVLLAGERGGEKIPFFPHGNSPLEYMGPDIAGNYLILTTSNGTRAIRGASRAAGIYICSLLNAQATAKTIAIQNRDIVLICAGTADKFSLEDTLGAGVIIQELLPYQPVLSDLATTALLLANHYAPNPVKAFQDSRHGQKLERLGLEEDLIWCAQINKYNFSACYQDGKIQKT